MKKMYSFKIAAKNELSLREKGHLTKLVKIRKIWIQLEHPLHHLLESAITNLWWLCGYRAFLSTLPCGWPNLTPHDLRPQHCTTLWSGVLPTKLGSHGAFLSNWSPGWLWLTPAWPSTPVLHYILVRGSSYQIW